ncbi:MAG: P-loop NTPase, partial [Bdellovibrionales bacterium]|nr:P-loop NTPase [Bdellovibrionales bacterium]
DGAVVVTTPQNIALSDVIKSIDMFKTVKIPVLGIVENMSHLRTENGPVELFPKGDLRGFLDSQNIPLLTDVSFHQDVTRGGEMGLPIVETKPQSPESVSFFKLADQLINMANPE